MEIIWWSGLLLALAAVVLFTMLLWKVSAARRAARNPNCLYCGSPAVRLSSPDHWIDPLLAHWKCVPFRCEVCYERQYRYLPAGEKHGG